MPIIIENSTPAQFRSDRLAQVKAIVRDNPGITVRVFDGITLAGVAAGIELRVRYDEATNTLEIRRE